MPPGGAGAESGVGAALPPPQPQLPASHPSRRTVAGLLQQYGALNRLLLKTSGLSLTELTQLSAACVALQGCSQLAKRLPLRQDDMFRLGSALALVFGAGLASVRWQASLLPSRPKALVELLVNCNHQLAAAAKALQQAAHPQQQREAAAAFVRTAGRPQAVLPWLLAVSQALLAVPADIEGGMFDTWGGAHSPATGGLKGLGNSSTAKQLNIAWLPAVP